MCTNRWRRWLHRTVRTCRLAPVRRGRSVTRFTPRLDPLEDRVVPASYSVTTPTDFAILADNSDVNFATGQITDHGNAVSLRSAVIASNHTAGPNTITLPAGTYLITQGPADDELNHNGAVEQTGDLDVFSNSLTVTGAGSGTTVIDGNNVDRIFDVQSPYGAPAPNGITFNLSGVTLQNGHAPADGSLNENGGAIAFNGASASGPPAGQLILNNVVLKNNTAEGSGGGLYAQSVGAMTLTGVTFDSNTANHGGGGAIAYTGGASDGNVQVQGTTFTNNKALDPVLGSGGAIQVSQAPGGSFVVGYSSFSGNQAGTNGGALSDENAGTSSSLTLKESTVAGNSAGGNGGGVFVNDTAGGTATLASATGTNNRANTAGGAGVGGGIDQAANPAAGGVTLVNTIVAGNFNGASGSTADDARGTLATSSSYNLFGTGGSANLTGSNSSHNLFNVANPGLGALGSYGGPTLTVPLLAGSPALDAGINSDASNADQRNGGSFLRVVDLPSVPNAADGTDIGAFESRGFSLTLVGSDSESTPVTTQFPNPLRVAVTARDTNVPVNGALVLFTGPVTTTGATIYPNPTGATVSGGIASATVRANFMSSPTSYTVLASLVGGVNNVPFHLTNTPAGQADLAVTNVGPTTPIAGTDVTFTITVKNNGPNDAQNVKLADTLPGSTTAFVSQSQTSGPAFTLSNSGNVISDTIATLTASATAVFSVVAHVPASVANNTLLSDTATVTTDTNDPNLSNNGSTASATITTQADLAVTQTGPANALAGTNVSYVIGLTNNGPSDAQAAVLGDTLPAGETFVSLTQTAGPTCTPGVGGSSFSEFINTLAAGASASFTVVAQVNANVPGNTVLNNTARASSSTTDPTSGNNSATAATTVGTSADLVVSNVGPATAIAGDPANVTYAITVTNAGPSDSQGVALADALPNGMSFVSQAQTSGPAFTLSNNGNSINDTITTLPGAASEVQTITVTGTSGTITLSFNGQSTGPLPYNATYGVIQGALSSLSTIGGVGGSVNVAQSGNVYTVGFQGSMTATAEPLLGAAGAGGAGATVAEVTHGGPGAPATFTLVAHVSPGVANNTVLNDTATVSAGTTDPNLANNSATVATRINPQFEFEPATAPLASGYTQVTENTTYSAALGYGWQSGVIQSRNRGTGDTLTQSFDFTTNGTFAVNVTNGWYHVTLTMGDAAYAQGAMGISFQGTQVDSVTTAAGQFITRTYAVNVSGGQLDLGLVGLGGASPYAVINALVITAANPPVAQFEFEPATAPLASGYTQVTENTTYSAALGYGWQSGVIQSRNRGTGDTLTQSFDFTANGTFAVNLADGTYYATVTMGDAAYAQGAMGISFQGTQVDSVTTAAGQFITRTYAVNVSGGQLDLGLVGLGGASPYAVINALVITAANPPVAQFEFEPATAPLASGYTQVTENTTYSAALGYGWQSGVIQSRNRGTGDTLTQSFDFTTNGTFAVNVTNGWYHVTLTMGDAAYAQGAMGISFQGTQVDSVTTAAGQFITRTYAVTISNGQLDLGLVGLGGASPYAVINALTITAA